MKLNSCQNRPSRTNVSKNQDDLNHFIKFMKKSIDSNQVPIRRVYMKDFLSDGSNEHKNSIGAAP